jgi:DNA-binding transcriptional regulator YhcF (GntR family)
MALSELTLEATTMSTIMVRVEALPAVPSDPHGEVPIGVQLAWALRARIGDGRLIAGERLPGLRELAEALGINANTARAVYQRLEQEGLIDSRQGTGTFVAGPAGGRSAEAGQIAADAALRAQSTGVDPREVAAALYVAVPGADANAARGAPAAAQSRAAERRRELRGQIAALEQTLSEMQMLHPSLIPAPAEPARRAGPRLLSVEDLEEIRTDLLHRLAEAEPLLQAAQPQQDEAAKATGAKPVRPARAKPARSAGAQPALHSPVPTIRPAPAST